MDIKLEKAAIEQKSVLRNLLELYNYEFTEFEPDDVDEHGLYGYKYLDHYWTEEGRHPFFIRVDGKLAGFVLVREIGTSHGNSVYSMAEFFVMKKYRKTGVGRKAANMVFDTFIGEWKVSEIEKNVPAQCFWRRVVGEYTVGSFEEIRETDWDGPIQRFVNA